MNSIKRNVLVKSIGTKDVRYLVIWIDHCVNSCLQRSKEVLPVQGWIETYCFMFLLLL